jgi:hypothetical protein
MLKDPRSRDWYNENECLALHQGSMLYILRVYGFMASCCIDGWIHIYLETPIPLDVIVYIFT